MASFDLAIDIVLDLEGGYQNHPADWGNYNAYNEFGDYVPYAERVENTLRAGTNRGISAGLYSGLFKREVSVEEMQKITLGRAKDIYRKIYWNKIQGDLIDHQALANLIFDTRVNHGPTGIKMVQLVINHLFAFSLEVDGVVGPQTLEAINKVAPDSLHDGILDIRIRKYHDLANSRPGNDQFLNGWLNRLEKFPRMLMAGGSNGSGTSTSGSSSSDPSSSKNSNGIMMFVAALLGITFFNDQ